MVREEALTGPNKGAIKDQGCTSCVSPLHHGGQGSLDLSVTAYAQNSPNPTSYLFQGYFLWTDTFDWVNNLPKDYVSLGWNGNLALDWHNLNAWYDNGGSIPWQTQQIFPGQGVVMSFNEWLGSSGAKDGFASALASEASYHGEKGNIVFTYHHTWTGFTGASFWPTGGGGISFGTGTSHWEEASGNTFWY
ncbi:hypothetical protein [Nitrolancea hollandica]|uniref:Uncharacterized protein n=1 Tax=Nitrolancea hollandica Lb TaxID=1129897 RepID=I4EKA3_9BACT|nr:hypothetical protein [Nitrolancea hollandica]CCF85115.1 hypothetical protein NITHO_4490007 [Nitrolancea hollandica Lb]